MSMVAPATPAMEEVKVDVEHANSAPTLERQMESEALTDPPTVQKVEGNAESIDDTATDESENEARRRAMRQGSSSVYDLCTMLLNFPFAS